MASTSVLVSGPTYGYNGDRRCAPSLSVLLVFVVVSCCVVFRPAGQRDLSASQVHEILARLRGSQRASQSNDSEEVVNEGNLLDGSVMQAMGTETTLYARALRPEEMLVGPAMMTRQFMAERLPVSTAQTGQFGIPADQYHACILAIQPLQLLWEWAGLRGKRKCLT